MNHYHVLGENEMKSTENEKNSLQVSRRDFLKLGGMATLASFTLGVVPEIEEAVAATELPTSEKMQKYKSGQQTPSICVYCSGGCGLIVTSVGGKVVEIEGDPDHPINEGALCSKASAYLQLVNSDRRLLYPMKRTNPNKGINEDPGWVRITWDEAFNIIARKVKDALMNPDGTPKQTYKRLNTTTGEYDYYFTGKESPIGWYGAAYFNNEECYIIKKMMSLLGSANVEHQARKCHGTTVAGLANTFGFGAMTNHIIDAKNSKVFLIVSNPAESHSMEFRWVQRAIDNGAKVIVLDPRYNRTTTKADYYARYRSGAEAALFMGLINYAIVNNRYDKTYLEDRTTAPYHIDGTTRLSDWETNADSVFGRLKAVASAYTSEVVEKITGIPKAKFEEIANVYTDPNNRPGNIYYAMGTTQHTNASQAIRGHAILQLLLGNMGVPGGGVNALRGISNVQGSTDANVLCHTIAGYRSPPGTSTWYNPVTGTKTDITFDTQMRDYQAFKNYYITQGCGGVSGGTARSLTDASYSKTQQRFYERHFRTWNALELHWGCYVGTWPGINTAADSSGESIICDLPVARGTHTVEFYRYIRDGKIKVAFIFGDNSAVSVPNANLVRNALSKEGVFVVVDEVFETETAWYADILLPGTTQVEREGTISNTGRWIQWRYKAADPPGECKPEIWVITELFKKLRKDAGVKLPSELYEIEHPGLDFVPVITRTIGTATLANNPEATWPSSSPTWDSPFAYGTVGVADPVAVFKEMCARNLKIGGVLLASPAQPHANILYRNAWDVGTDGKPQTRADLDGILSKRRDVTPMPDYAGQDPKDSEDAKYGYFKNWAFSWSENQRVMYNPNEKNAATLTHQFFHWWAHSDTVWDTKTTKPYGIFQRAALWSRPLYNPTKPNKNPYYYGFPLHNEPLESPDATLATDYPTMWDHHVTDITWFDITTGTIKTGKTDTGEAAEFPYVLSNFRLAEHMQAGAMTRNLSWLVEAHPEMFVEINPDLASTLGVSSGDYVYVKTARNKDGIKVKAIVTERVQPLTVNGKKVHVVSMPWHWGFKGLSTGPSANEITIDSVDVAAWTPEYKTCLCNVVKA